MRVAVLDGLQSVMAQRQFGFAAQVAQRYQCDMRALARANAIKPPRYMVQPGQKLKLEGCRME